MTIKEAIIRVLSDGLCQMTAEEIYDEIIKQGLYTFGAKNPLNVVRNVIESACDNSTYSENHRAVVSYFHFEKNSDGKRVYCLQGNELGTPYKTIESFWGDIQTSQGIDTYYAIIWDSKVEQEFQKWLEQENYAQKTADNYRRAAAQIFRTYDIYGMLARQVVDVPNTKLEAVRKYIALLNEDTGFVATNATRHNQYTAALAALERFYSCGNEIVDSEDDQLMTNRPGTIYTPASSFGNIVDLEEGKEGLREILEAHFQTLYGYSNISIVWNAAQDNLSLFLNDNAINTAEELWRFMCRAFLGEYVMSNSHIWKTQPDYPQSYVGVVINLARQFGGTITREQIDEYFARIKQGPPINANIIRQGYLVFCASKRFTLTEAVDLSSERVASIMKSLDGLFERERVSYIVLRDISNEWLSSLPMLRGTLNWTPLLLQEILRLCPTIGYRTVLSGLDGQALDTLGAAIVPGKSDINSFADVVHRHCYENGILGKKMLSEALRVILREAGMLEGNELIYNLHKALRDYRFAFTNENRMVKILDR